MFIWLPSGSVSLISPRSSHADFGWTCRRIAVLRDIFAILHATRQSPYSSFSYRLAVVYLFHCRDSYTNLEGRHQPEYINIVGVRAI
jgi:hypothetical protein